MTEQTKTIDEQIAELMAKKKNQEKEQKQLEKEQAEQTKNIVSRWNSFVQAEKILKETDMKFFRDGAPRYFRKLTTTTYSPTTNIEYLNTEIKFYAPGTLRDNWLEFESEATRRMFRIMVEGGDITVVNPETNQPITVNYPERVYDKLTNTLKRVDNKTYNLLSLEDKLDPLEGEYECPILLKALLYAISGCEITYDDEKKCWVPDKPENLEWLEKWLYGTVYADIGNNMASFPVIFGPGKVGKNALFDIVLKQCLGKEACFTGTWDLFHGNFDGYKIGKVCMFIDEVPEKGSWETLKNMTGSTDSFVKQKYGAEFVIENTVRYVIGTNSETYPLPVEDGPQMVRVSPIRTTKYSTFAENTVRMWDKIHGIGSCRELLKADNDKLDVDSMDDYTVGDSLLRGKLHHDWASREAAQNLINYLHCTYKSSSGNYSNPPLRGRDWQDIMENKAPGMTQLIEYIVQEQIETISVNEAFELYKVLQGNKTNANSTLMTLNGFAQRLSSYMKDSGYKQYKRVRIQDKSQTTIYTTTDETDFSTYEEDVEPYILEKRISNNITQQSIRTLKYGVTQDNKVIQLKLSELKKRV